MSLARIALDRTDVDTICIWAERHTGTRGASHNLSFIADLIRNNVLTINQTNVETHYVPSSNSACER